MEYGELARFIVLKVGSGSRSRIEDLGLAAACAGSTIFGEIRLCDLAFVKAVCCQKDLESVSNRWQETWRISLSNSHLS